MTLRVLYLFAGQKRRAGMREALEEVLAALDAEGSSPLLAMEEVDLHIGGAEHDLLDASRRSHYLSGLKEGLWHLLLESPPCTTSTRVRYHNYDGPSPLRSLEWPDGFPWLTDAQRASCEAGSALQDFALDAALAASEAPGLVRVFLEFPEDLGQAERGIPCSIWSRPAAEALRNGRLSRGAFRQSEVSDVPYSKPTGALTDLPDILQDRRFHKGWPSFRAGWWRAPGKRGWHTSRWSDRLYKGPLPRQAGRSQVTLVGHDDKGNFRTDGTAAWPYGMCLWIARAAVDDWLARGRPSSALLGAGVPSGSRRTDLPEQTVTVDSSGDEGREEIEAVKRPPEIEDIRLAARAQLAKASSAKDESSAPSETALDSGASVVDSGWAGSGDPLRIGSGERQRIICDGGGLCSPGLWPPTSRRLPTAGAPLVIREAISAEINALDAAQAGWSQRLLATMASNKVSECPFPADATQRIQSKLRAHLAHSGLPLGHVAGDLPQPVSVRLLGAALKDAGDPDWSIFGTAGPAGGYAQGVRIGVGVSLPRTPAVFPPKTRWALPTQALDDPAVDSPAHGGVWNENYPSALEFKDIVRQQLEEMRGRDQVLALSEAEAKQQYGDRLVVASLGAIVKSTDEDGKPELRLLQDATNNVPVNSVIKVRDLVRTPIGADLKRYQRAQAAAGGGLFGLVADIKDAHRLVAVHPDDWPLQACQVEHGGTVYLHKRGTFGVASAGYWWGRLGAGALRMIYYTVGHSAQLWATLVADDLKLEVSGGAFAWGLLTALWTLLVFDFPLKWSKVRGGLDFPYVGYRLLLKEHSLGVSESRAAWLVSWMEKSAAEAVVHVGRFGEALGRAAFAFGALEYDRPFLAPLYTFVALHRRDAVRPLPLFAKVTLLYLARRVRDRSMYPSVDARCRLSEPFRIDAKAEGEYASIGGWLPVRDEKGKLDTSLSPWFMEPVTREAAPWAFIRDGQTYRVIASLEALAVTVAMMAFVPIKAMAGTSQLGVARLPGFTDNRGNTFAVESLMSTKFPLCLVVMELAAQAEARRLRIELEWAPRDLNEEADALTNSDASAFNPDLRVDMRLDKLKWLVMPELMEAGMDFDREKRELMASRAAEDPGRRRLRKRRREDALKVRDPW